MDISAASGLILLLAMITIEFLREGRYPGSVEVASGPGPRPVPLTETERELLAGLVFRGTL